MATNENINNLKVHKFKTYKQYNRAKVQGLIGEDDAYVIESPETIKVESAKSADSATKAADADQLGGVDASAYAKTDSLGALATKSTVSKTDLDSDVQASLDKADSVLTPDWDQIDPTKADYIKNKTHYIKSRKNEVIVDNVTVDSFAKDGDNDWYISAINPFQIPDVSWSQYKVIFDGVEYICDNQSFQMYDTDEFGFANETYWTSGVYGNAERLGIEYAAKNTNEPFAITIDFTRKSHDNETKEALRVFVFDDTSTSHTISIIDITPEIEELPLEYIASTGAIPQLTDVYSFRTNDGCFATGNNSFATGIVTRATADNTAAFGVCTLASGHSAVAFGRRTAATGNYSTAFGQGNIASERRAIATGYKTIASGNASFTAGAETIASGTAQFSIGMYNAENENAFFIVGNGASATDRKNAFEVLNNGDVNAAGNITATTFTGSLNGNASTATDADKLGGVAADSYVKNDYTKQMGIRFESIVPSNGFSEIFQYERCDVVLPSCTVYLTTLEDLYGPYSLSVASNQDNEVIYSINGEVPGIRRDDVQSSADYNEAYSCTLWSPDYPNIGYLEITGNSFVTGSNNTSKGKYELVAGRNNTVMGVSSVAFGDSNIVLGESSTAIAGNQQYLHGENSVTAGNDNYTDGKMAFTSGWNNINNGDNATIGSGSHNIIGANAADKELYSTDNEYSAREQGSTVQRGGSNVFIAGKNNRVSSWNSVAFNENNVVTAGDAFAAGKGNTVTGNYSAAFGQNNNVYGQFVFAAGEGNTVEGRDAFSAGVGNTVSGDKAAAFNDGNTASGPDSFAIGQSTEASNEQAFAQGHTSKASGKRSVAMGIKSEATNDNAIAIGNVAHAYGTNAIAIGRNVTANNNNSMAMGYNATANADNSVAIGLAVTADANAQFVAGKYNKANNSAIFIVGAGRNDSDRENAIEVYSKTSGADPTINIKGGFEVNAYDQYIRFKSTSTTHAGVYINSEGDDTASLHLAARGRTEAYLSLHAENYGGESGIIDFVASKLQYSSSYDSASEPVVNNYNAVLNDNGEATRIARIFGTDIMVTLNATSGGSGSGSAVYKYSDASSSKSLLNEVNLGYTAFGAAVTDRYYSSGAKTKQTYCYPVRVNGTNHLNARITAATTSSHGVVKVAGVRSSVISASSGSTTSGRYYGVEIDSDGKLFVNVPWTSSSSEIFSSWINMTKYSANDTPNPEDNTPLALDSNYFYATLPDTSGDKYNIQFTRSFDLNNNQYFTVYDITPGETKRITLSYYDDHDVQYHYERYDVTVHIYDLSDDSDFDIIVVIKDSQGNDVSSKMSAVKYQHN